MVECVDCIEALAALEPASVDHSITDPPYSQHTHEAQRQGCTGYVEPTRPGATRAQFNRTRDLGFAHLTDELREYVSIELARVVRRWVLVFSDHEGSHAWKEDLKRAGLDYVRTGVWIKRGATPQFSGDRPATGHECIVIAHQPGQKRWNGGGRHAVWDVPIVLNRGSRGEQRIHTTQKPLALMEALVRDFTDEGETIVDPFAGSGTTLVAAKRNGRFSFGYEVDPKYAALANKRLAATSEQRSFDFAQRVDRPDRATQQTAQATDQQGDIQCQSEETTSRHS